MFIFKVDKNVVKKMEVIPIFHNIRCTVWLPNENNVISDYV